MTFEKRNIGFFIVFILIGAILGSATGTLLSGIFPVLSIINKTLTGPVGISLEIISIHLKLNISSIIGVIFTIIIYRKF